MAFQLPELPYPKDALAPHMSPETLEFHHGKHHAAYVKKTNELVEDKTLSGASLTDVVRAAKREGNSKLFNNSAQLWNHSFFWQCLAPAEGQRPEGKLAKLIEDGFGSTDAMLAKLKEEEGKVDEAAEILQEVAVVRMLSLKAVSHQMIPVSDFTSLRPAGPTKQGYRRIS